MHIKHDEVNMLFGGLAMFPALMEKGLSKIIKDHWASLMKERLPDYLPYKEKTIYLGNDERAWWLRKDKIALFVIFKTHHKGGVNSQLNLDGRKKCTSQNCRSVLLWSRKKGLQTPINMKRLLFGLLSLKNIRMAWRDLLASPVKILRTLLGAKKAPVFNQALRVESMIETGSVMIAALNNLYLLAFHGIHQPMLIGNPA